MLSQYVVIVLVYCLLLLAWSCFSIYLNWLGTYWERRGLYMFQSQDKSKNFTLAVYKSLKIHKLKHGSFSRNYESVFITADLNVIRMILRDNTHFRIEKLRYYKNRDTIVNVSLTKLEDPEINTDILKFLSGNLKENIYNLEVYKVTEWFKESNESLDLKHVLKVGMELLGLSMFDIGTDIDQIANLFVKSTCSKITEFFKTKNLVKNVVNCSLGYLRNSQAYEMFHKQIYYRAFASLTYFALVELSQNPNLQAKLREEIRDNLKKKGKVTIMKTDYLSCVIKETLRKYPPISSITYKCQKPFQILDTDIVVQAGQAIAISILGINSDSEYYQEPNKFDSERFLAEKETESSRLAFLSVGDFKYSVEYKLAELHSKAALVYIINKFIVTSKQNT